MSKKIFSQNDIFFSRLKVHPERTFFIYNSEVYIDKQPHIDGASNAHAKNYKNVPGGFISLYELNVNRTSNDLIKPFLLKEGSRYDLRNNLSRLKLNRPDGNIDLNTDVIQGKYPLSASITRMLLEPGIIKTTKGIVNGNTRIFALNNLGVKKYSHYSKRFVLPEESLGAKMNIVDIPSIFYGSSIKKGTLELKYYITGTLLASAIDERRNGELVSNYGVTSVSIVCLVYYDEGIIAFPSASTAGDNFTQSYFTSPELDVGNSISYDGNTSVEAASWLHFGAGANDGITHHTSMASASFSINFLGTSYKNTLTLMCHADKGELNFSNNPTYIASGSVAFKTSSFTYYETERKIKNIASSSYHGHNADFKKVTYLSKIGIYDENDNLIMTAEMARPYKKEEEKDLTFKLKYDLI